MSVFDGREYFGREASGTTLGLIGLGRYSGECFPVLVACGIALERVPRAIAVIPLVASAAAMAGVAIVMTTHGLIP